MVKIKIDIGKEAVKEAQERGDFVDPPPGLYVVEVRQAEQRQKDGGEFPYINVGAFPVGAGRKCLKLEPPEGVIWGTVWDRISLSPASEGFLVRFALAMGMKINRAGKIVGSLELEEGKAGTIIGKRALMRVKAGTNQDGDYRAEVGSWFPYDPQTADGEEDFDDEDAEEEVEEEDAFGEDEEETEDEYYTADYLNGLENSELSDAAKEFDLNAKDFIVKVRGKTNIPKTREAIITAILDAQGAPEGEAGDEEPF